jgi:hypothetical protein
MNIPITLDAEHQKALNGMLTRYNESASTVLTEPEYLAAILHGVIGGEVKALFDAEVERIGKAASSLSYAGRQALIAQIEAQLPR